MMLFELSATAGVEYFARSADKWGEPVELLLALMGWRNTVHCAAGGELTGVIFQAMELLK
jgi:hypothetical protein